MSSVKQKIDDWILQTTNLHQHADEIPPHGRNLLHQLNKKDATSDKWQRAFEIIMPAYFEFQNSKLEKDGPEGQLSKLVLALNNYMQALKRAECQIFKHQADFYSSVIPEVFHKLYTELLKDVEGTFVVSTQKDLIVECIFDAFNGGRLIFKKKRVDVAIVLPCILEFNGLSYDFSIPVVAMEVKTNIDKNMLSGIEQSVESLKRTFPTCLYLAVAELADFAVDKQNYATTYIDEIYILRKQKRSEVRKKPKKLQAVDTDLIEEIAKLTIDHILKFSVPITTLKERMISGLLINKRNDTF